MNIKSGKDMTPRHMLQVIIILLVTIPLISCEKTVLEAEFPDNNTDGGGKSTELGVFGNLSITNLFKRKKQEKHPTLNINSFLWRASLDTVSFIPLSSADPIGGTIITEWHKTPDNPNERFKIIVYISSKVLRSNGINVKTFRQTRKNKTSEWESDIVSPLTNQKLENKILQQARKLVLLPTPNK